MRYKKIRNLIAEGKLSSAMENLKKLVEESNNPKREELYLQCFRLNDKIRDLMKGIASLNEVEVLKNRIAQSILHMLNDMEQYESEEETETKNPVNTYHIKGDMIGGDKYKAKKITINKK